MHHQQAARSRRVACWLAATLAATGLATAAAPDPQAAARQQTMARLTTLRDAFVAQTRASGPACQIAPPTIATDHVPSFGQYDDTTNTLHTADWTELSPEEKDRFVHLAPPGADAAAAQTLFEAAAHRWIFIHELGHWWQACRHANATLSNYQTENGANRIALAYWRQADPPFAARMLTLFRSVTGSMPRPVPPGQSAEPFFNSHYTELGPTLAYQWYQSHMIVALSEETPAPSFATTLAETRPAP